MTSTEQNRPQAFELNLDGIIGPTHNFSGLSYGNIASTQNYKNISNPKEAAKQGLAKMKALSDLGIKQAVMPPQERPFLPLLYTVGYSGRDEEILKKVFTDDPALLLTSYSSSSMWTANAATVSPSADTQDNTVHFTAANLISKLHRSIETPFTAFILKKIFANPTFFTHHYPLPPHPYYADEGAANHTRFCQNHEKSGVELFVYGRSSTNKEALIPRQFPARQTFEASQSIARLHKLNPQRVIFAQQNPQAIDAGVFHNDVISVGNQNVFFYHEDAFIDTNHVIQAIRNAMEATSNCPMHCISVNKEHISLEESVITYLFNSQLITLPDQTMTLIAPVECQESSSVYAYLSRLVQDTSQPIRQVMYQNIHQSMQNGGGPACLRLRIVLTEKEYANMHPHVILTPILYDRLIAWIDNNYRDRLAQSDLTDPSLLYESRIALNELTQILKLGPIYHFQHQ